MIPPKGFIYLLLKAALQLNINMHPFVCLVKSFHIFRAPNYQPILHVSWLTSVGVASFMP